MSLQEISNFIDNKIEENYQKIVIKFFELKIKQNLTDQELIEVLRLMSVRLENFGYTIYKTGESYFFNRTINIVENNELIVAIKKR